MWDPKKYKSILDKTKERGSFHGKSIKSKMDIYEVIQEFIYVDKYTVKGWARPTSKGPGNVKDVQKLEALFGLKPRAFEKNDNQEELKMGTSNLMSDVNKTAIFNVYCLMKDYLHDDDMEMEECFSKMWLEVEKHKLLIPVNIFEKITEFIDSNLAPIIYDEREVYKDCYTEDIGYFKENGNFQIRDEEGTKKFCMNFLLKNIEIEESLDEFAMKELYPYLV